jgi:hypothetical protein
VARADAADLSLPGAALPCMRTRPVGSDCFALLAAQLPMLAPQRQESQDTLSIGLRPAIQLEVITHVHAERLVIAPG